MVRLSEIIRRGDYPDKGKEEKERGGIRFREMISGGTVSSQEASEFPPWTEPIKELPPQTSQPALSLFGATDWPATRPDTDEIRTVETLYEEACRFVRESMGIHWKGQGKWAVGEGLKLVQEALEVPQSIEILYNLALKPRDSVEFPVYHVANVFIFSLKVGKGLRYGKHQMEELGLAALFHDIGYGRVPAEIVQSGRALTPEEMREVRAHPTYGYEILLSSLGEDYKPLAEVILQTHERENGQGYPRGLKGKEIHEYAKVIGIADVFEALTHARPHRKRLLPYEAVKEILGDQRGFFPYHLLKVLIQEMSVFPIYSYVKLNSGAIGKVIATDGGQPLRPTVEILYDSEGKRVEGGKVIRLVETPLLHITGLVDEREIVER